MFYQLQPHPDSISPFVTGIDVELNRIGSNLDLRYVVRGRVSGIRMPPLSPPTRADGLWQHTCFEAFIRVDGVDGYSEFNLAPSTQWAAYAFDGYREGMRAIAQANDPRIMVRNAESNFELTASLDLSFLSNHHRPKRLALSAIIEDVEAQRSYWSLAHSDGKPDFHHADGFIVQVE